MIRYVLAALALKMFSVNRPMKAFYRTLGNTLGQELRKKEDMGIRVSRGNQIIDLCKKYRAVTAGDQLLELGPGWIHWYGLYLLLHYDVTMTMFDVCDNRQFGALKAHFSKLRAMIDTDHTSYDRKIDVLDTILAVNSFEALYTTLGLRYIIDRQGCLDQVPDNSFDCVFSVDVLEQVPPVTVKKLARDINRILKAGGYSIHQIGIDDYISMYDSKESPKNYLRYSDRVWKMCFESDVQYFNRLQVSDWLGAFAKEDLVLVEKVVESCDIGSLKINANYQGYEKEDLACTRLTIVHRKAG